MTEVPNNIHKFALHLDEWSISRVAALIKKVATDAASSTEIPFEVGALNALEDALETVLSNIFVAAGEVARQRGSDTISGEDIRVVQAAIKEHREKQK